MLFSKEDLENWDEKISELKSGLVKSYSSKVSSANREIWMKIYAIGLYVMAKEKIRDAIFYGWNKRYIYLNKLAKDKGVITDEKHIDTFTDLSGYIQLDKYSKKKIFETLVFHLKYTAGYKIDEEHINMLGKDYDIIPVIIINEEQK
jgi:hypothetical protein